MVLPLAMPGYVFTLFALGARDDLGLTWLPLRSRRRRRGRVHADALPVRVPAGPQRVPEPGRRAGRGRPRPGPEPAAGDRAGGGAHRPPGDPGRRGAGADGVAGRLRQREPAGRPDVHQRHLQGLQRRLRPRRRAAAGHAAGVGHADAAGASSAPPAGGPATRPRAAGGSPRSACAGSPAVAAVALPLALVALVVLAPGGPADGVVGAVDLGRACWRPSSAPRRATACCWRSCRSRWWWARRCSWPTGAASRARPRPAGRCGWPPSATGCPARWWRSPCWCRWAGSTTAWTTRPASA